MTELERILKETLLSLEQDLTATLANHDKNMYGLQLRLEAQNQNLQELFREIQLLKARQQESEQLWQRLSSVHASLQPVLTRLNNLLSDK